jgi:hypothetical protein
MSPPNLNDNRLLSLNLSALDGSTGTPLGLSAGCHIYKNSQLFWLWQIDNALREGLTDATTPCGRVQGAAYGIQNFEINLCAEQILNYYVKF